MQPNNFPIPDHYQLALFEAWKKFTVNQQEDPIVPPLIAASWRRSWGHVNPNNPVEFAHMSSQHVLASQTASFDLMAIARPVMEDTYQCIQKSGIAIILTNSIGCVLDLVGDPDIISIMDSWGCRVGSILSEELIGTTSIGLALTERMPVQVAGSEHFVKQFHVTNGAAAPMFDITGRLLGVLGMVMPVDRSHIHSLGLVAAATRAIESQRQSDVLFAEQNSQLSQLNTILSVISEGILVIGANHKIVHANHAASQMLGIPAMSMMGKQPEALFTLPSFLSKSIFERTQLVDVEGIIKVDEREINCLISLDYVFKNEREIQWLIITLRSQNKIRKLVQRQLGTNATLTLDDIPGDSPQLDKVRRFVKSAAGAQASILIRGEAGTGKNALASAIHNASYRKEKPFVVFSCSSIPNELAIAELLGYEESYESKHTHGQPSKFELADEGTLFFQDVDSLPLEAQSVLLNALELGVIQRLGSRRAIEVSARVIASTSANIEALISQGAFRPDLYYRLSTFAVTLPPLRERPRDIPLVVNRIFARFEKQLGYKVRLAPEVMDVFKKYPWPGNIREVESVLGRAAMQVASTGVITMSDIPMHVRRLETTPQGAELHLPLSSLEEMEHKTIVFTAQLHRGNVSRMAHALGVGRTTLWRKLKSYGIDPEEYRQRN